MPIPSSPAAPTNRSARPAARGRRAAAVLAAAAGAAALAGCAPSAPAPSPDTETWPAPSFSRAAEPTVEAAAPIPVEGFGTADTLALGATDASGQVSGSTSLTVENTELPPGTYTAVFECSSPSAADGPAEVSALVRDSGGGVLAVVSGECPPEPRSGTHETVFSIQDPGASVLLETSSPGVAIAARIDAGAA